MNIIPFQFESNNVRVIEQDGEPWFVARDVAEALGYAKPQNAISRHCSYALKRGIASNFGVKETLIIPEGDVYRLIIKSKLPQAQRFERWVMDEVLPSIRKKGSYSVAPPSLSRMEILKLAVAAEEECLKLKAVVAANEPKIETYNRIANSEGSMCITDVAKNLQMNRNHLFRWMADNKWIYRRDIETPWIGYQTKVDKGLLMHKTITITRNDCTEKSVSQVRVTPKGLVELAQKVQAFAA